MIDLFEFSKDWETDRYGWKIAPIGLEWIPAVGARAKLGARATVGDWATVGEGAAVGDWASLISFFGYADGFAVVLAEIEGAAHIGGGCKFMTLAAALEYVAKRDDRPDLAERIGFAAAMAARLGLK